MLVGTPPAPLPPAPSSIRSRRAATAVVVSSVMVLVVGALAVVDGDPDLLADDDTLADAGTLAFYDFRTKVVNVRGHTMTPGLRVTLAHELTHVLQDQHFDVTQSVDGNDDDATEGARSVV